MGQTKFPTRTHEIMRSAASQDRAAHMPGREIEPRREQQPQSPYIRAARFGADAHALSAYSQAQTTIFASECDLSAYRIRFKDVPHVVVLGSPPTPDIDQKLTEILKTGDAASLPTDIISTLTQRRAEARRMGPWVEGHYRPGKPM